jgi:NAD-dependent SIR2 family protein deacetylase
MVVSTSENRQCCCPKCGHQFEFEEVADAAENGPGLSWPCPSCNRELEAYLVIEHHEEVE